MISQPKHWSLTQYKLFLAAGAIFSALAVFLYNYYYLLSEDDLLGLVTACSLFLGALLLGQGIRGWREFRDYDDQFFNVSSKKGINMSVRKRGK